MRLLLLLLVSISFLSLNGQTPLDYQVMNNRLRSPFTAYQPGDSNQVIRKWQLLTYGGLSAGNSFLPGTNNSFISAPVGLQLSRRINNNVYAFAGASAAPAYLGFPHLFTDPGINRNFSSRTIFNANQSGIYSKAELGLMYINDERTFSISGSFQMDRVNYPAYVPNRPNTFKQKPVSSLAR